MIDQCIDTPFRPMVVVFQRGIVYSRSACTCYQCDEVSLEAWERMTDGGITARYGKSEYRVLIARIAGQVKWVVLDIR